jgi:nucleotide-binding universal stress UspA family protein
VSSDLLQAEDDFPMRVVLAYDGSPSAIRAVDYVIALAARSKAPIEVELINAQEATVGIPESFTEDSADVASRLARSCREAGTALLAEPLAKLDGAGLPSQSVVVIGDPATCIGAYIDKSRCDAVVMGTRGLGAVAGLVLGSVAAKIIHLVKVPVTLVK